MFEMSNGTSRSDKRVVSKNQASASTKKAGTSANVHPPVAYNTVPAPPSTLPLYPSNTPGKKFLDPAAKGFHPSGAAIAEIVGIIKKMYMGPYHCWSKVPQPVRDMWFKEFEKKYCWFPQNHCVIRGLFESHGGAQLKKLLSKVRVTQQRPEWIGNSIWKQLCEHWAAEESKSKTQSKHKINQEDKNAPWMIDEEDSSQSSIEDTWEDNNDSQSQNLNIPPEVKTAMDKCGKEFHEKVTKLIETVNRVWIRRVESLERERDELKGFVQLYYEYLQNYEEMQEDNNDILKGLSEKLIIKDNAPPSSLPPHHPNATASRPPPPPVPHYPKAATSTFRPPYKPNVSVYHQPPRPPTQNPNITAFRPPPPQHHPNFPNLPTPQPYQPNLSAYQTPPNNSGYGFQGTQPLGQGNGYWNKVKGDIRDDNVVDDDDDDDDFNFSIEEYDY